MVDEADDLYHHVIHDHRLLYVSAAEAGARGNCHDGTVGREGIPRRPEAWEQILITPKLEYRPAGQTLFDFRRHESTGDCFRSELL